MDDLKSNDERLKKDDINADINSDFLRRIVTWQSQLNIIAEHLYLCENNLDSIDDALKLEAEYARSLNPLVAWKRELTRRLWMGDHRPNRPERRVTGMGLQLPKFPRLEPGVTLRNLESLAEAARQHGFS